VPGPTPPSAREQVAPRREVDEDPSATLRPGRRVLRRFSTRAMFRFSLAFYFGLLVVSMIVGTILWFVLKVTGVMGNIESFMGELLGYEDFKFLFTRVMLVWALVGLVWVAVSSTTASHVGTGGSSSRSPGPTNSGCEARW